MLIRHLSGELPGPLDKSIFIFIAMFGGYLCYSIMVYVDKALIRGTLRSIR